MKPWEIIKALESNNSRTYKEKVLAAVSPDNTDFWEGVNYALNPDFTYGVKKVPVSKVDGSSLTFHDFKIFLGLLNDRHLSGGSAIAEIARTMALTSSDEWNYWYRRILIKDLRCGVTATTINKIRPNTIQQFACQLATDVADKLDKVSGIHQLDMKLDGIRALVYVHGDECGVVVKSRTGKVLENFKNIEKQLLTNVSQFGGYVLDGEITSANFQKLMTQTNRKTDVDTSDSDFNVFDIIPITDFDDKKSSMPQHERTTLLSHLFDDSVDMPNVFRHYYEFLDMSIAKDREFFELRRDQAKEKNYEGIMLKDFYAMYEYDRTMNWKKVKPTISVDLSISGMIEGEGKYAGMLGALICEGDDDGKQIKVSVGSGISDDQRVEFWKDRDTLIGHVVEIKADAVTKNKDGGYSLRFPRFKTFRGFVPGEKI